MSKVGERPFEKRTREGAADTRSGSSVGGMEGVSVDIRSGSSVRGWALGCAVARGCALVDWMLARGCALAVDCAAAAREVRSSRWKSGFLICGG